mmetsp:Transcript_2332/g.4223  ORF Transcript_2332/g.4223 Transcript_2332/m.4223 type:complete len:398 (-) Transcript_2332:96-1289(-)
MKWSFQVHVAVLGLCHALHDHKGHADHKARVVIRSQGDSLLSLQTHRSGVNGTWPAGQVHKKQHSGSPPQVRPPMPEDPLSRQSQLEKEEEAWFDGESCIIPMWNMNDYTCKEYDDAKVKVSEYTDFTGVRRILVKDGRDCTVQCPNKRWWQAPQIQYITCDNGVWRNPSGMLTPEVSCITSSSAFSMMITFLVACCCCCTGLCVHLIRQQSPKTEKQEEAFDAEVKKYKHKLKREEQESSQQASQAASKALSRSASQHSLAQAGLSRTVSYGTLRQQPGTSTANASESMRVQQPGEATAGMQGQQLGPAVQLGPAAGSLQEQQSGQAMGSMGSQKSGQATGSMQGGQQSAMMGSAEPPAAASTGPAPSTRNRLAMLRHTPSSMDIGSRPLQDESEE